MAVLGLLVLPRASVSLWLLFGRGSVWRERFTHKAYAVYAGKRAGYGILAKEGDEDPDFIYDEAAKMWYMTVCRPVKEQDGVSRYRYFLFRSHDPFEGYEPVSHALSGEETGGSFVRDGKGLAFVCGNGFAKRAEYRVYRVPELSEFSLLKHDYDDGGFRGWGTVIPVLHGSRKSYYHLTFDRHNASDYTWSYGNLYCFKAEE